MTTNDPRIVNLEIHSHCRANVETVWSTFVDDIGSWWGDPYVSSAERIGLLLDARPGGALFEDWGNGNGTTWATVRTVRRPHRIEFDGTFKMNGALYGTAAVFFEPSEFNSTRITLNQQAIGAIEESTLQAWTSGWNDLLGSLKRHCETTQGGLG